ncbi:unnamed protein product [Caenorhabditis bovis]|uniref:Uncharacterized protein n=1 Tax=Caenorhabditis bovis TaxID=2654633 RepID=A0A8S1ET26_9PELO|nr:unnamed protein product [Caenorhabditis bovis]
MPSLLRRSATINEATETRRHKFALKYDLNDNVKREVEEHEIPCGAGRSETFVWDWPFSTDGTAPGAYTPDKFIVCLPFNKGGTGEKNGTTKKFERIAQSDFSWSMGLGRDAPLGSTCFWRLEIEIIRNLNAIVLIASRDISRYYENTKRLKRVRKMYKLPEYYDVSTTTTTMYDWAVIVEARKKSIYRPTIRRASTLV